MCGNIFNHIAIFYRQRSYNSMFGLQSAAQSSTAHHILTVLRANIQILEEVSDSSSLTNEKDHHYFLNCADVCW